MDRNLYDTKITQTFTYLFDDINMKTWLNHIEMNDLYVLPKRKCMNKQSMLKFLLNQRKLQSFTFFSVFLFIYLLIYCYFFSSFSCLPGAVNYTAADSSCERKNDLFYQQAKEHTNSFPEDNEEERPSSLRRLVSNFAASTTAHGVSNIAAAKSLPKRMVWLVVTVALYAVLLLMCCQLIVRYKMKPVVSRTEMSFEEVQKRAHISVTGRS